jgi:hypothetical protein
MPTLPTSCSASSPIVQDDAWKVTVQIFVLASGGNIATDVQDKDIPYAIRAFDDAWSGLRISAAIVPIPAYSEDFFLNSLRQCKDPRDDYDVKKQLERAGVRSDAFKPNVVTVAYVQNLYDEDQTWGPGGQTCAWDEAEGTIVLLSHLGYVHTTFAHELGHVFGLTHADELDVDPRFDRSNLMWPAEGDLRITSRGPLTLGQVFRVGFGKGTFVEHLGGRIIDCDASPSPCPGVRKDILVP